MRMLVLSTGVAFAVHLVLGVAFENVVVRSAVDYEPMIVAVIADESEKILLRSTPLQFWRSPRADAAAAIGSGRMESSGWGSVFWSPEECGVGTIVDFGLPELNVDFSDDPLEESR